jgi:hypothetical protein
MKKLITILCLFALAVRADNSAHIQVRAVDASQTALSRIPVTLTPLAPLSRTISTNTFSIKPLTLTTSTNGIATFSNMVWGYYRLDLSGNPGTTFKLMLGTNHSGVVNAAVLYTNSAAMPPDPATNYYTMAQVDALIDSIDTGGGGGSATNVYRSVGAGGISVLTNGLLYTISNNVVDYTNAAQTVVSNSVGSIMLYSGNSATKYLTLTSAVAAAVSGDQIVVSGGSYTNQINLAKDGVDWEFTAGALVVVTNLSNAALFNDASGAVRCNIGGSGTFIITDTNVTLSAREFGLLNLTKSASEVYLSAGSVVWTSFKTQGGTTPGGTMVKVTDAKATVELQNVDVTTNSLTYIPDPEFPEETITVTASGNIFQCSSNAVLSATVGLVYWGNGVYATAATSNPQSTGRMSINTDYGIGAASSLNHSCFSTNFIVQMTARSLRATNSNAMAITSGGSVLLDVGYLQGKTYGLLVGDDSTLSRGPVVSGYIGELAVDGEWLHSNYTNHSFYLRFNRLTQTTSGDSTSKSLELTGGTNIIEFVTADTRGRYLLNDYGGVTILRGGTVYSGGAQAILTTRPSGFGAYTLTLDDMRFKIPTNSVLIGADPAKTPRIKIAGSTVSTVNVASNINLLIAGEFTVSPDFGREDNATSDLSTNFLNRVVATSFTGNAAALTNLNITTATTTAAGNTNALAFFGPNGNLTNRVLDVVTNNRAGTLTVVGRYLAEQSANPGDNPSRFADGFFVGETGYGFNYLGYINPANPSLAALNTNNASGLTNLPLSGINANVTTNSGTLTDDILLVGNGARGVKAASATSSGTVGTLTTPQLLTTAPGNTNTLAWLGPNGDVTNKNAGSLLLLSTNNGVILTNLSLTNINAQAIQTSAFTNGVAARVPWVIGGTVYYLTLSTNVP